MLSAAANAHAHQRILLHSLHFIYPFAVSARFCQMISGRPNENAIYIAKRERQGLQRQQRRACNRMTIKAQRLPWPLGPLQYAMTHLIYVAIMINERLIQIPVISMILNEHIAMESIAKLRDALVEFEISRVSDGTAHSLCKREHFSACLGSAQLWFGILWWRPEIRAESSRCCRCSTRMCDNSSRTLPFYV